MFGISHRKKAAKSRANKVTYLTSKNKKAQALYGTGVLPHATYGAETVGYSVTFVGELRTMAASATGTANKRRCPITALAAAKGYEWDLYVRGPVSLIQEWCRLAPKEHMPALQRAWTQMEGQLRRAIQPWHMVPGPISAAYMHFQEMGWAGLLKFRSNKTAYCTPTKRMTPLR